MRDLMTDFWIDFSGYCKITARDRDSAEALFYKFLDSIEGMKDVTADIDCIEEVQENV